MDEPLVLKLIGCFKNRHGHGTRRVLALSNVLASCFRCTLLHGWLTPVWMPDSLEAHVKLRTRVVDQVGVPAMSLAGGNSGDFIVWMSRVGR